MDSCLFSTILAAIYFNNLSAASYFFMKYCKWMAINLRTFSLETDTDTDILLLNSPLSIPPTYTHTLCTHTKPNKHCLLPKSHLFRSGFHQCSLSQQTSKLFSRKKDSFNKWNQPEEDETILRFTDNSTEIFKINHTASICYQVCIIVFVYCIFCKIIFVAEYSNNLSIFICVCAHTYSSNIDYLPISSNKRLWI